MGFFRNVFYHLPSPQTWLSTRTVQTNVWTLKPSSPHAWIVKVPLDRSQLQEIHKVDIMTSLETGELTIVGRRKEQPIVDAPKPTVLVGPLASSTYEPIT